MCGTFESFVKFVAAVSHQSVDLEFLTKLVCDDIPLPNSLPFLLRETSRKNKLFNKLVILMFMASLFYWICVM